MPTQHRSACLIMLPHNKERIAVVNDEADDEQEEERRRASQGILDKEPENKTIPW